MELGMIGLGRMGTNMVRRLLRAGHQCVVFDLHPEAVQALVKEGAVGTTSLEDFTHKLKKPRAAWMMVPAAVVDPTLNALVPLLERDDVVIDGGNSYYHDDLRRAAELKPKGIHYVDVGTSGGVWGSERGYCLMIGGDEAPIKRLDPVFAALAPSVEAAPRTPGREKVGGTAEHGYLHCGPSGAGHFVKMVHNGIEYGIMAAYAEGLNILRHANADKQKRTADAETTPLRHPELYPYDLNLPDIAEVWRRGSVIASWLLDLAAIALLKSPDLAKFTGRVSDSGEGRWTIAAAIDESVPAPVLSAALYDRFSSRGEADFGDRVLSALRYQFGGHEEKVAAPKGGASCPPPRSDALVFFGATGDLAYKQIFPALQALIRRGHLDMPVVGVARSKWSLDQLKARAKDSLEKHGHLDPAAYAKLCSLLGYIDGDYGDPTTFTKLRKALGGAKRPLYYLAIPPSLFATVAEGLAKTDCVKNARVVVEKPFGRDLASAQELNRTLHRFFPEQAIFRIDHYLGKEPVQNLIYFRFANPLIEAGWDNQHIESVQITMAESFGVAGRGKFYEEAGAIRDVVQNHMLEVIACLAEECPAGKDHEARRDERGRLLKAVRTLDPSDVARGQFRGYRREPGVATDSQVETFAALRFHIDNERWKGVPFYVRVGKCLPVTATEVLVRFKQPPRPVLDETGPALDCYCRFRFSPEVVLALGTKVKKPGERMVGERIELVAHHQPPDEMEPYERLLGDAAIGDATLFAREDSVEAAWRVVDPVLGNKTPLCEYEPNTWGPPEVERTLAPAGGWHNPKPKEASA